MVTVGLAGAGMMGSAVGGLLVESGHRVLTCDHSTSVLAAERIRQAGLERASVDAVVAQADVVLSIMGSSSAPVFADEVRDSVARTGRGGLVFGELNLVEPAVVRRIASDMAGVGVAVVDGGIAGDPPRPGHAPTVYLAGPARERLSFLREAGFPVRDLGDEIGVASAVKVCSAAVWQGCLPLVAEVAAVAATFGMLDVWLDDIATHQRLLAEWFVPALPVATSKAPRWQGDMAVVARTLEAAGASGMYHTAAGRLYGLMAHLPVGPGSSAPDVIAALAAALDRNSNGAEGGER